MKINGFENYYDKSVAYPCVRGRKNFLELSGKSVRTKIVYSLKDPMNKLGQGGEAEVWRIAGTEYCVRLPLCSKHNFEGMLNFDVSETDKINHAVAKLSGGISIMPLIRGFTFNTKNIKKSEVAAMVENMPQEAFDELFKQVYNAENHNLMLDEGNGNIIINPQAQKMTAIDFCPYQYSVNRENFLNALFYCLNPANITSPAQRKICAQKLLSAPLNVVQNDPKVYIDLSLCGFQKFVARLGRLIHNRQVSADLGDNLERITELNFRKFIQPEKRNEFNKLLESTKELVHNMFVAQSGNKTEKINNQSR